MKTAIPGNSAACVCDLFGDGEWKRDKKVTDFSSPDTQLHMSFQRQKGAHPTISFPSISHNQGSIFPILLYHVQAKLFIYRPRFPSTAAFDPSWLKSSQAWFHMVNPLNLDTCRTVRRPWHVGPTPTSMATRLPGEPSSAPHKKIYAESKVEQKSFLKKVFSQKIQIFAVPKYPNCIRNQHGFYFRFEKKTKRRNHRFHPGISTGIGRCSKWNAPPNSHRWTLFEPGFPPQKEMWGSWRPPK